MNKAIQFLLILLLFAPAVAFSQQMPIYNQYLVNKFALAPAYAGYNQNIEGFLGYRQNWVGVDGAPEQEFFSTHGKFKTKPMGIGMTAFHETTGNFKNYFLDFAYSYHLDFGSDMFLCLGANAEFFRTQYDLSKVKTAVVDLYLYDKESLTGNAFDAGFSAVFATETFNVGLHANRLIGMKAVFDAEKESHYMLARQFTGFASYLMEVKNGDIFIEPTAIVRTTMNSPVNYELSVLATFKKTVWAGLTYRKANILALTTGVALNERIVMNYSYEYGLGSILGLSSGTHEVSIGFLIRKTKKRRAPYTAFKGEKEDDRVGDLMGKYAKLEEEQRKCCDGKDEKIDKLEKDLAKLQEEVRDGKFNVQQTNIDKYAPPFVLHNIKFASNSDRLFSSSFPALNKLAQEMKEDAKKEIQIIGYTDNVGSTRFNIRLSKKRAEAIKEYLVKVGINADRVITDGKGEENAIASNNTEKGRSQNRRIEAAWKN